MEQTLEPLWAYFGSPKPWITIALIVAVVFVWVKFTRILAKKLLEDEEDKSRRMGKQLTVSAIKWAVIVVGAVLILQVNGIDVPGILAGLGIAGIVVGFALQDLLKDLIMGASIIWDNYFSVGDMVRFKSCEGKVVSFSLKTTKIADLNTGNIMTVSNRNISEIELLSDWCDIDVPFQPDVETSTAREAAKRVSERIAQAEHVKGAEVLGCQELGQSAVLYRVRAHCDIEKRNMVRRSMLGCIQDTFDEMGLKLPDDVVDVRMAK